ncbi:MAG: MFS transporter [Coriobacteriia bacterium]|nr:MFS transporter [Coriobacteriia bacterium]MBS5478552.1 MFS transporter [Coriobacteriia bacterium]
MAEEFKDASSTGSTAPSVPSDGQEGPRVRSSGSGFSRSYFALVVAQIISLLGDRILCFALPLYVLNLTGSASLYSVVTASALVPYIVLTPVGGVVADRVMRQRLMACLDCVLALICVAFLLLEGSVDLVVLCICAMVGLYAVQAFYAPTVQASVPSLVGRTSLIRATAITNQVTSLVSLVGPFVSGMLYGFFGLTPILVVGIFAFACSCVVVSLFVHTPRVARPGVGADSDVPASHRSPLAVVAGDLRDAGRFLRTNPPLIKTIALSAALNFVLSAFANVGLPVIVTQVLGLSNQLMGVAEACVGVGGLLGGAFVAVLGPRLRLRHASLGVVLAAVMFVPMALVLRLLPGGMVSYGAVVGCLALVMAGCQMFTIQCVTYVQLTTPDALIGKVISLCVAACMCAAPAGQLVWGVLFDAFRAQVAGLALAVAALSLLLALATHATFRHLADPAESSRRGAAE